MSLFARQIAFRDEIASSDDGPAARSPGMQIYREAYRGRLLAALEATFERTRRWAGDDAFTAAACHCILTRLPRDWTLDSYGAAFPEVLAALFAADPEVAELAWLEWHLEQAFAAPDRPRLDPAALAAAGYGEGEWERLRFIMAPGFAARRATANLAALWPALDSAPAEGFAVEHGQHRAVAVWRDGLSARWRELGDREYEALAALAEGGTLGTVAARCDAERLGQWLARWLSEGLFAAASPGP